jgi:hypothetical protein
MRQSKLYLVVGMIFWCQIALAQPESERVKSEYVIPFQLTDYNNLSVQAVLNRQDTVHLMFHTAANAVTLTEEALKRLKSVQFNGTDSVKSWGGNGNSSRFSTSNSLQIGELTWTNVPIWENVNSGQYTDGKFGTDLFEKKVIEIDFDRKVIVLHAALPDKATDYEKLKLAFENGMMFVVGNCEIDNQLLTNRFLIHSGYAGAILLDDKFVSENKLDEKLTIVAEKELTDSFGNVLKTKKAGIPAFSIGKQKLNNV